MLKLNKKLDYDALIDDCKYFSKPQTLKVKSNYGESEMSLGQSKYFIDPKIAHLSNRSGAIIIIFAGYFSRVNRTKIFHTSSLSHFTGCCAVKNPKIAFFPG